MEMGVSDVESVVEGGESGGCETADEENSRRKRPYSTFDVPGYSESDTETEGTAAAKVNTARRGRGKGPKAGHSREEFLRPHPVSLDGELEEAMQSRKFKKRPATVAAEALLNTGSDSDVLARFGDLSGLNAQELRAQAGEMLACILEVAKKSGNLKGEFVARLKRSASTLREVVDALACRSEAEETRRLRAECSRLRLEVKASKEEVKALRRGFTEAKTQAAAATSAAAVAAAETPAPPAFLQGAEIVEELRRSLTMTFGDMLNSRLAMIEERLLPKPISPPRPPLKVDAKTAAAVTAPSKPTPRKRVGQALQAAAPPVTPSAGPSTVRGTQGSQRVIPAAAPSTVAQVCEWATVVKKGKGKGKGKGGSTSLATPAPAPAPVARAAPAATKPTPKPKASGAAGSKTVLPKSPQSAVVVLSLQPEAAEKGVTYSAVLQKAQEMVDLQELGIDQLRFRQTATGARMLEIPGSQNKEKADRLAEKLRGILSEVANVTRPFKSVEINVTGLDDAATKEKVAAAVAKEGGCDVLHVKVGEVRHGYGGAGSCLVSCPVPAAKVLVGKGRILVGWSSVRVVALAARPMRCYRCMGLGHTRPMCPASADRGDLCFRCGGTGHRAANCERTTPRCTICSESGRPSGHRMGGRSCVPPKTTGKATRTQATPPAAAIQAASEVVRRVASMEVVMPD